jgi:Tfp pilus assembly protein PilO
VMVKSIESGLSLISWMSLPSQTNVWYKVQPIEFELQGKFDQLLSFFSVCSDSRYSIQLSNIRINSTDEKMLIVHCVISVIEVNPNAATL